ncbi:MAG: hypothetical protein P8J45_00910 [Phycisphaerales bacterium]|nr:hypothetical protein [Phycisphaerales bacterium]
MPMDKEEGNLTTEAVDRLFAAAAAIFCAVVEYESNRSGRPVLVKAWFLPTKDVPWPCTLDPALTKEASAFLVRMGILKVDDAGHLRLERAE